MRDPTLKSDLHKHAKWRKTLEEVSMNMNLFNTLVHYFVKLAVEPFTLKCVSLTCTPCGFT